MDGCKISQVATRIDLMTLLFSPASLLFLSDVLPSPLLPQAFILLSKGAKDAGPSTRSALLPLMAESYLTYFATTR